ncbi:molybdopterin oxidoreductase [Bdellovibrio reynosensis]|uniref:Molybdopterin oxidoreductase n=1 Tax=Bdellovibrio reynosensis TaxID=2835041 RepID=A0ABY4CC10_9BACT|nr:molybdopterin oxidoreductase [Bdellovibrio reynosensis]UOF02314.1 molybdopterin oxidoreductase [Bdellovibrio reynosensis]
MGEHKHVNLHVSKFEAPAKLKTLCFALIAIGLLTFVVGLMKNQERLWTSYLVAFFFFSAMALSGLFWVAINNTAKAGWSVTVRRFAEATSSFIPGILIGGLILLAGFKYLFPWANPEVIAHNPVIAAKTAYLNTGFFVVRLFIFAIGCLIFRWVIVGNSLKQDQTGDAHLTEKNVGPAVGFIAFFALAFSFFSVDLLMSLLPTWYSTIFGIYTFAGMFQAGMAFLSIVIVLMKKHGYVKGYVTDEHQHDVVKYLKGFSIFWAYIAFSQFMLMWYANIPEETEYYIMRAQGGWLGISALLVIFRFVVPFLALLPRGAKRSDSTVLAISTIVLIFQYVDIYWMVYPNFFDGHVTFGFWEIGIFAGFAGIFLLTIMAFWAKHSLVPLKDPRIHEAINHHVAY